MGVVQHHAVVFVGDEEEITALREIALHIAEEEGAELGARPAFRRMVSEVMRSPCNTYYTFFLGPDGASEDRPCSEAGEAIREFLTLTATERGVEWAEVSFGDLGIQARNECGPTARRGSILR